MLKLTNANPEKWFPIKDNNIIERNKKFKHIRR